MAKKVIFFTTLIAVLVFTGILVRSFMRTKENRDERIRQANLIVYASSSFMDVYGPGTDLKAEFEKTCDCTVEYVDAGGASTVIEKMKLNPSQRVDVLLGLDHLLLSRLARSIRLQPLERPKVKWRTELQPFLYPRFLPYNWSPMGFVYRKSEWERLKLPVPRTLEEALEKWPRGTVTLPDPSLSTPGLQLLYWIFATVKDYSGATQKLNRMAHSFSPSWSGSYGLFKKNQAPTTWSYLSSLVYHWMIESNHDYQFMKFEEPHPAQIEYAAVPENCWNCTVAKRFIYFLISPSAQKIIAEKNYMLPVVEEVSLDSVFQGLPHVEVLTAHRLDEFVDRQAEWIEIWKSSR